MTSTLLLLALLFAGHTDFTPHRSRVDSVLEGSFMSCPDNEDGTYGERIYQHVWHGKLLYEIHLGPRDEFGVFTYDTPAEHEHLSKQNLLLPAFHYEDVPTVQGGRNWGIASLNLHLNVIRVDGSWSECYTYVILATQDVNRKVANR